MGEVTYDTGGVKVRGDKNYSLKLHAEVFVVTTPGLTMLGGLALMSRSPRICVGHSHWPHF